jgi:hypothetical protein
VSNLYDSSSHSIEDKSVLKWCCGQTICDGCNYAQVQEEIKEVTNGMKTQLEHLCPFCREPHEKDKGKRLERIKELMEKGNPFAMHWIARS